MKREELKEILLLGQAQNVEFKSNCENHMAIGQTVCAFLNSAGGTLVCGAGDQGKISGIKDSKITAKDIEDFLQKHISPKTLISVHVQEVEGRDLLIIEVPSGKDLPYAFQDVIYIRSGQNTQRADVDIIRDIVLRKQVEPERWERRFSFADLEKDIDADEIHSAVIDIQKTTRTFFKNPDNIYLILGDLSVAKYGRLTNAGDVLFCRNPARRLPQVRVRATCFISDKADTTFKDMKSFEGPLVPVLNQLYNFIIRNTPTIAIFSKDELQRRDEFLYPPEAIREALVNAFVHRDYSSSFGGIAVSIYPKRLEIWNSGSLPAGLTPEMLTSGHISVLRNPDIAHVMYLRGFMEKIGRGSVLILRKCREKGLAQPVWTSDEKRGVTLTFFAPEVTPEVLKMLRAFDGDLLRRELQLRLGLKDGEYFRKAYLQPALKGHLIEMTLPEKPRSSKQRYRLTKRGKASLETRR